MRYLIIVILLFISLTACRQEPGNIKTIDFSETIASEENGITNTGRETIKVAVSAMSSPRETFSLYEDIIRYIADHLDMAYEFHQRRTYEEINKMLEDGRLDFAFICSGAYVELDRDTGVEILSVPVTRGNTFYHAYIIVPDNSPAQEFIDLKGKEFAFTELLSNTGYLYPRYRIIEEGEDLQDWFSSTVFTYAHDTSIQMVVRKLVDGASVHSMVFDYLLDNEPERVRGVRIIEKSESFGIPPVVASGRMDDGFKEKVREILQNMHNDSQGREFIHALLIDRFIDGNDTDYDRIRDMRALGGKSPANN